MKRDHHRREDRLRAVLGKARPAPPLSVPVSPALPMAAPSPAIVMGRAGRVMLNSGEAVPIRYAVAEADWLITSHRGLTYERDPRYPTEAQPRDYAAECELQFAVEGRAGNLDLWQILTDSVLPVDGPPVVRGDGVVISGNGRTQSMRLAMKRGLYDEVRAGILERGVQFRFDAAAAAALREPVLIRLMQDEVTETAELARYGIEMNRDPGQGMSASEQSISLSRLMTPGVVAQLSDLVGALPAGCSVREFMRLRAKDIAVVLSRSGLVDPRKRTAYFTPDGDLTEVAKDLVETTLAGLTVKDIEVIRGASRSTRDRLVRAGIGFARIRNAGPLWDLAHHNNEAVRLVTEAEDRAEYLRTLKRKDEGGGDALVERLLHPERFQHAVSEFGFRKAAAVHPAAEALAMALELAPRNYVAMINAYAARAQGQWASMFECVHPATVFTETIGAPTNDGGACRWSIAVREEEWEWVGSGCELSLSA